MDMWLIKKNTVILLIPKWCVRNFCQLKSKHTGLVIQVLVWILVWFSTHDLGWCRVLAEDTASFLLGKTGARSCYKLCILALNIRQPDLVFRFRLNVGPFYRTSYHLSNTGSCSYNKGEIMGSLSLWSEGGFTWRNAMIG